jgi:hypothetical protein
VHLRQPTSPAWERLAPGREKAAPLALPGLCPVARAGGSDEGEEKEGARAGRVSALLESFTGGGEKEEARAGRVQRLFTCVLMELLLISLMSTCTWASRRVLTQCTNSVELS